MLDYALDAYFGHPPVTLIDTLLRACLKAGVVLLLLMFGWALFRLFGPQAIHITP